MKPIRVVRYILVLIAVLSTVYAYQLIGKINDTNVDQILNRQGIVILVGLVSMVGATILGTRERSQRWKDFIRPLVESFAEEFQAEWETLSDTGILADPDAAYSAVATVAFKRAWAKNVPDDKKAYYDKATTAGVVITSHAKKMGIGGGYAAMVTHSSNASSVVAT